MKPKLSIILPCYNEVKNIPLILKRFAEVIGKRNDVELILVNNGSNDESADVLKKEMLKPKYKFARTVLVKKNQGYGYGVMFGLRKANGTFLAYTHADMQCEPKDVIDAYSMILSSENPQKTIVKGWRKGRFYFLSFCFLWLSRILFFKWFTDINAQPKVFPRHLLTKMTDPPKDFTFDFYVQYVALKSGMKSVCIPVEFGRRIYGESKWAHSFRSRIKTAFLFIKYLFGLKLLGG